MSCRVRRTGVLAACAAALLAAALARAADTAAQRSDGGPRRLDLGLYGRPYGPPGLQPTPGLRFDEWVDVEGAPSRSLQDTMAVWWKHFDLGEPAIYGRGYDLRPNAQPNAVNLVPVFQKLYDKLKKRK